MKTKTINTPLADTLGHMLAEAANMKDAVADIKAELINLADSGKKTTAFEGELFRATVTFGYKTVSKLNVEKLAGELGLSPDRLQAMIDGCTDREVAEGVPTVKCSARKAV